MSSDDPSMPMSPRAMLPYVLLLLMFTIQRRAAYYYWYVPTQCAAERGGRNADERSAEVGQRRCLPTNWWGKPNASGPQMWPDERVTGPHRHNTWSIEHFCKFV